MGKRNLKNTRKAFSRKSRKRPITPRESLDVLEEDEILILLRNYKTTGDRDVQNQLVQAYIPIVKKIVNSRAKKLPKSVDYDTMLSAGLFGLLKAIDGYDESKGDFDNYASLRINGQIMDDVRKLDYIPRPRRAFSKRLAKAIITYKSEHDGDSPSEKELAKLLKMGIRDFRKNVSSIVEMVNLSYDENEEDNLYGVRKRTDRTDFERRRVWARIDEKEPVELAQRANVLETASEFLSPEDYSILFLRCIEGMVQEEVGYYVRGLSAPTISGRLSNEIYPTVKDALGKNYQSEAA